LTTAIHQNVSELSEFQCGAPAGAADSRGRNMKSFLTAAVFALLTTTTGTAFAVAIVGKPAPDFALNDVGGKTVRLAEFKGRHVILEWHNPRCPFVMKHYDSGNMPSLQSRYDTRDVVWLSINSTHPEHQDYMDAGQLKRYLAEKKATPYAYLLDPDGKVGTDYAARTTPHIYVISPAGMLAYAGAIDDKRSTRMEDVKAATNYLVAAVAESKAGKAVSIPTTQPYGCSVKYR
jgi:peroxiredoxin